MQRTWAYYYLVAASILCLISAAYTGYLSLPIGNVWQFDPALRIEVYRRKPLDLPLLSFAIGALVSSGFAAAGATAIRLLTEIRDSSASAENHALQIRHRQQAQ